MILFPQTIVDNSIHTIWGGTLLSNPNACWDWVGWYGQNADQKGGKLIGFMNYFHLIKGSLVLIGHARLFRRSNARHR